MAFDGGAGHYLVLCFIVSAGDRQARAAIAAALAMPDVFHDKHALLCLVSNDPQDEAEGRIAESGTGYRVLWDFDRSVTRLYGVSPVDEADLETAEMRRSWVIVDPLLRVRAVVTFKSDGSDIAEVKAILKALPPPDLYVGFPVQAPVIILPQVFEPDLCKMLVGLHKLENGSNPASVPDLPRKIGEGDDNIGPRDYLVEDLNLIAFLQSRFIRRVVPEIAKVHHFAVTRMERYLVSCFTGGADGPVAAQRDNATKATAHRRFAASVNLNDDFDGGEIHFPEYGPQGFKAPPGGAVVYSCALLNRASPVTRGHRYAFLPFLYDDAAARLRDGGDTGPGAAPDIDKS
jgi:hypothetical protein